PLAGDSPPLHAAHERTRIAASADARMRFSVQLASMHRRIARLAAVLLLTCAATAFAQPAPVFTSDDVLAVRTFAGGQPIAVAPDGRRVAYVLTDLDDEWNVQEPRPTGHVVVQTIGGDRAGAPH